MQKHRNLLAWQQCRDLSVLVYRVTLSFPKDERFGLTSQLRRAAVSATSNIAEGHARLGASEYSRFLSIALGSLAEVDSLIEVANAVGALPDPERATLSACLARASRTTLRLQRSVRVAVR